jgi:xylan 1,4-beta-xylosidase
MRFRVAVMGNVNFYCNVSETTTPFPHFWEHTIGSGHAPLALRADWQKQLQRCHEELGFRHVRFHDLFSEQMSTLICHQEQFLYSFFNADQIFDFLLSIGTRPFVELSFMPDTLASGHETVFNYRAIITPPKDYNHWAMLIRTLVSHWIDRYGAHEVGQWFFEVWNEPNLKHFWTGTQEDYFKLYRHTVEAIKEADASLKVGGPATAANAWIEEFLDFCEKNQLPGDFISTHHYPTDAFGVEGDDTETQLSKSRRSILRDQAQNTRRRARGKPVYYTEWNASSNPRDPLHDEPYAAAFVTKTVMEAHGLVEGYSFWTFTDIFEENYFPSVPFHGGFGLLTLHGIPKPTYRAFELVHHLGTEQLLVDGSHDTVDAWVIRKEHALTVLLTNHALPRHPINTEHVQITLSHAPTKCDAYVERIDEAHANPRAAWCKMGEPAYLSASEVDILTEASRVRKERHPWEYADRALHLDVTLPSHAVAAITVEFASQPPNGGVGA